MPLTIPGFGEALGDVGLADPSRQDLPGQLLGKAAEDLSVRLKGIITDSEHRRRL